MRLSLLNLILALLLLWPYAGRAAERKFLCTFALMTEPELREVLEKQTKLQNIPNGLSAREFSDQLSQAAGALLKFHSGDPLAIRALEKVRKIQQISAALNYIYPLQFSPNILPAGGVVLKRQNEFFESISVKVFEVQRMDLSSTPLAYVTLVKIRVQQNLRAKFKAKNPEQIILPRTSSYTSAANAREFFKILPLILDLMDPILLREDSATQVFAFVSRPSDRVIGEFLSVDARLRLGLSNSFISEVLAANGSLFYGDFRAELMHALNFGWLPKKFSAP